ncbi:MAG: exodeoxyribonuclease III [Nanoarchaeota archaeon]|nr:exodeoxyribonuclease III [Nanoarchaeota archaeon]
MVTIFSWNVNGIRAILNKGFYDFVKEFEPDVLCLQETKAYEEQVKMNMSEFGYEYEYWNSADKKGYSGVAIFSKIKPIDIIYGIEGLELSNSEGRVLTCEFENYYVVTVYTPNAKDDLSRIPLRYEEWDPAFLRFCKQLEMKKPVIFCGDLNVAHEPIDLKNDKANVGKKGFTYEEREGFSNFIEAGFIDTFRELYPQEEKYSWWTYMGGARSRNVGWRIDYVCISKILNENLIDAKIHNDVMGSDHCPVSVILKE